MGYKDILTKIEELQKIVAGWRDGEDPALLEKDMALERVKSIYEMLRFPATSVVATPDREVVVDSTPEPSDNSQESSVEQSVQEAEVQAEETQSAEDKMEEVQEEAIQEGCETEEQSDDEVADDEDLSLGLELVNITQLIDEALEDSDMISRETFTREIEAANQKKRERLNKILSLYDEEIDEETHESAPQINELKSDTELEIEPEPEQQEAETTANVELESKQEQEQEEAEEPQEETEKPQEQEIEVEEVTVETKHTECTPIEASATISLLGINDKILLSHELFGGDDALLIETLSILDAQPTLDDAIIYIAERYSWSGDNEGAQLLMTLLQSRYQN